MGSVGARPVSEDLYFVFDQPHHSFERQVGSLFLVRPTYTVAALGGEVAVTDSLGGERIVQARLA